VTPKKLVASLSAGVLVLTALTAGGAVAQTPEPPVKVPTSIGFGGAVSSVDPEATNIGIAVLRNGGNAVDAAVATAAALGVTEPYSAGIGGGGYFVYYNAKRHKVFTIDGRETAPATMPSNAFIDPATGQPYRFTPELVTSGVSVGVPGTLATWDSALKQWGSLSLGKALQPAADLADRGFVVDETFRNQTLDNKVRFEAIVPTAKLFLPGGDAPQVGSVFQNPELADTYELIGKEGPSAFYTGPLAQEIATTVQNPPKTATTTLPVMPGHLTTSDLASYNVIDRDPTKVRYDGLDVYSMAPSSSGGTTVGEALNILATADLAKKSNVDALHYYFEASALAFADRGAYVGDPAFVDVPTKQLLSKDFGAERACNINPTKALVKPVAPGVPDGDYTSCTEDQGVQRPDTEGLSTTHLTAADRWGNVVSYTLTIEQTGGSGITVPGRGFLLNNELTDFTTVFNPADPNRIQPGKRPRSSMSPTIVLRNGKPFLALGSPGGSTIITTVLQTLTNRLDRGMTLPEAIAAPRASQRNTANVTAEPAFLSSPEAPALQALGHNLVAAGQPGTLASEIGAVAALEFLPGGAIMAAAEPKRRGGGAAATVTQVSP
jgi:gamma-glutamyltranspeptidase/glutathione hydrolase